MSDASAQKIMGIVPKNRYVHFAYMFLIISAAGNVLFSIFSIIGLNFASATPALIVCGLATLVMVAVGLTKHKNDFTPVEHAHFKYMAVLFIAFFILYIVFGGVYAISYFLGYVCTIALGIVQSVLAWTGYNSWQGGRIITKDNIQDEIKTAIKNR